MLGGGVVYTMCEEYVYGEVGRAVGTGPTAAEPIFGQPIHAKIPYELRQVVKFLLQE